MLLPLFSPRRIKDLSALFFPIAYELRDLLSQRITANECVVDMNKLLTRTGLEIVAQATLGYSFGSLDTRTEFEEVIEMMA